MRRQQLALNGLQLCCSSAGTLLRSISRCLRSGHRLPGLLQLHSQLRLLLAGQAGCVSSSSLIGGQLLACRIQLRNQLVLLTLQQMAARRGPQGFINTRAAILTPMTCLVSWLSRGSVSQQQPRLHLTSQSANRP